MLDGNVGACVRVLHTGTHHDLMNPLPDAAFCAGPAIGIIFLLLNVTCLEADGGADQLATCPKPMQMWTRDESDMIELPRAFSMPCINANGLDTAALAERCSAARTPVLIRGLMDRPEWHSAMNQLANRSALLAAFGDEEVRVGLSQFLTPGPEASSQRLDKAKLDFMHQAWMLDGSAIRDSLVRQLQAGEPMPRVQLRAWMKSVQDKTAPPDGYVFHNVSGTAIAATVAPLCVYEYVLCASNII